LVRSVKSSGRAIPGWSFRRRPTWNATRRPIRVQSMHPRLIFPPRSHCNPCEGHGFGPCPPRRKPLGSESGPSVSYRRGKSAPLWKPSAAASAARISSSVSRMSRLRAPARKRVPASVTTNVEAVGCACLNWRRDRYYNSGCQRPSAIRGAKTAAVVAALALPRSRSATCVGAARHTSLARGRSNACPLPEIVSVSSSMSSAIHAI
jgi:hypothetical protein